MTHWKNELSLLLLLRKDIADRKKVSFVPRLPFVRQASLLETSSKARVIVQLEYVQCSAWRRVLSRAWDWTWQTFVRVVLNRQTSRSPLLVPCSYSTARKMQNFSHSSVVVVDDSFLVPMLCLISAWLSLYLQPFFPLVCACKIC